MTADEWLPIVQAAIAKSGLPYRVFSCECCQDSATSFATLEHQRTHALRTVALSRAVFPPDQTANEIVHQLRAFNIDFAAPCAKGHLPVLQFEREEMQLLLAEGRLTFYCDICDTFREPTAKELRAIERLLEEPAA